jgi:hypothetical protein
MRIDQHILAAAHDSARALTAGLAAASLPVNVEGLAARVGVSRIESRPMKATGLLIADRGSLSILTRAGDPPHRRRFTIAHELGHILLARAAGEEIDRFHRGRTRYTNEERAADRLAAELLMPSHLVSAALRNYCSRAGKSHWLFLQSLQHRFHVSLSSVALRVLDAEGVVSVLFRTCSAATPVDACQVDCSRTASVAFLEPPLEVVRRLLRTQDAGSPRTIRVFVNGEMEELPIDHMTRQLRKTHDACEHWFIGWTKWPRPDQGLGI